MTGNKQTKQQTKKILKPLFADEIYEITKQKDAIKNILKLLNFLLNDGLLKHFIPNCYLN